MKKFAILSPMVILMASTSLAQDSCIIRPSCADMGYTKTMDDCTGKTTLKCPFDLSAVSCSASETAVECDWGERLTADNTCQKIENAIAFVIETTANNASITLTTSRTDFTVDWGDGTIEDITNTTNPTHTYALVGQYEVVITGNVEHFCIRSFSNAKTIRILNTDLDSVKYYGYNHSSGYCPSGKSPFGDCTSITGPIPNKLPPNLKTAEYMFFKCKNLYGDIPELPNSLERGQYMFYDCNNISGDLPRIPDNLTSSASMFYNCSNITGSISHLPNNISYAAGMFSGCSKLTGTIPELPSNLIDAHSMFDGCSNLEQIGFTKFPDSLEEAGSMFYDCYSLEGQIPSLANTKIIDGSEMFYDCRNLSGTVPKLPSTLTNATQMFYNCYNLSGHVPDLPNSLTEATEMFYNCNITSIGDLPSGITDMIEMFKYCDKLTSVGNLPSNVQDIEDAFYGTGLTQLPPNFANLTKLRYARQAFRECKNLTGTAPAYSNFPCFDGSCSFQASNPTRGIFYNTKITNNTSDPWPDEAWSSAY